MLEIVGILLALYHAKHAPLLTMCLMHAQQLNDLQSVAT